VSWNPVLTVQKSATDYLDLDEYSDAFNILSGFEGDDPTGITENLIERIMRCLRSVGTVEEPESAAIEAWLNAHQGKSYCITDRP